LVRNAHRAGLVTTAHVTQLDDARDVILAGVDGLAHMPLDKLPNNAFALLVLASHTFIAPTMAVFVGADGGGLGTPPQDDPRLSEWLTFGALGALEAEFPPDFSLNWDAATGIAATEFLHDRGVTLLAGTDAANPTTAHGASMHHEMELMVVYAGMSPLQALEAATSLPAQAFRLHDRGRIAPGKIADLLLVDGNPALDILATRNIEGIWKSGTQVSRSSVYLLANQPPAPPPACP
jgi:imidazolonepropionase-like amidohydrolase